MSEISPSTLEELSNELTKETETYRQLVAMTQREQVALLESDVTELSTIIIQKGEIVANLMQQEQLRASLVSSLLGDEVEPSGDSMAMLLKVVEKSHSAELKEQVQSFMILVKQLLGLNHGNKLLLESHLGHIESTFRFIIRASRPPENSYGAKGILLSPASAGNVLNRSI
jgi:flagellar biosynthesis/type III secretory pathway chaperone